MLLKKVLPFVFGANTVIHNYSDDFILVDKPQTSWVPYPVKLNAVIAVICLKGNIRGTHNMARFEGTAPCLLILLVEHTVTIENISEDFSALFIVMSKKFVDNLNIEERLPVFLSLHKNPLVLLKKQEFTSLKDYFKIVQRVLKVTGNPFIEKIIQHFTKAYFYGFGYQVHGLGHSASHDKKPRQEELVEKFLEDLRQHFRTERSIGFYANRLYVTPKYLSKVIKDHNGLSAKEWIEDYIVQEAQALLKSTDKTIQQISDELNFPTQSFFGKFFKRSVGLSPLDYRKRKLI
jgi:AraC-like DNA-binding protein